MSSLPSSKEKEKALLMRLSQGRQEDFREFYELFSDRIYNTALGYLKQKEEAEELMQDVFLKIYQSAATFQGDSAVSTWVYRITVNKCLDAFRKKKAKKRFGISRSIQEENPPQLPEFNHPGVLLENQEEAQILFKSLDVLADAQKTAFILSFVEELPRQEVADIMKVSLKAIESLLQRAKKKLRNHLEKYYKERRK